MTDGYRDLWAAVVLQAVRDAVSVKPLAPGKTCTRADAKAIAEARNFFLEKEGEWAESREVIAGIVNVCPDAMRMRVLSNPFAVALTAKRADAEAHYRATHNAEDL